jgi:hypothetical protein
MTKRLRESLKFCGEGCPLPSAFFFGGFFVFRTTCVFAFFVCARKLVKQRVVGRKSLFAKGPALNCGCNGAPRLGCVRTISKPAILRKLGNVFEGHVNAVAAIPKSQPAHSWHVDYASATRDFYYLARYSCVAAFVVCFADAARLSYRLAADFVYQRGFAGAGLADKNG